MKVSIFRSVTLAILALTTVSFSDASVIEKSDSSSRATYVVTLSDPSLVSDAVRRVSAQGRAGVESTTHLAVRTELNSAPSVEYLRSLDASRAHLLVTGAARLGRVLVPTQVYRYAMNGLALQLSATEAAQFATLPGVVEVRRERIEHVLTDAGPQWIGANAIWTGQAGAGIPATKGEGVVIGIIDTGINPGHPSFAATGGDGYTHTNPRGKFYGLCSSGQATCNTKLIGIYDFTNEGTKGVDSVGHGSHVSGIAAGNAITSSILGTPVSLPRNVSGVAPHANLIMYKACTAATTANPEGGCAESALIAALDQAIGDGVDVINYSIGGTEIDPFTQLKNHSGDAYAFYQARALGIVSAVAAGNDGPSPGTLEEPGNSPWVIGVANATHNRRFSNSIGNFTGAANPPATLSGQGYTAGYGPAPIVYAANYGFPLCGKGDTEGVTPTGASNPFAANTFHGEIVVCDRGVYARVEKGYNVKAAGAGGMILANAQSDAESTVSDNHFLPAVHLGYTEGAQLKNWLTVTGSHGGVISGVSAVLDNSYGDVLDASSSRGPYGFSGGILKPDITAPGSNILSSAQFGSGLALLTGTSMASPHIAGAAALVRAVHRDWSPSQVESALLGTALANSVRKEDAIAPATPFDAGTGRAQPANAVQAGLYLPMSNTDISAANPLQGGDPRNLNRPGIEDEHCKGQCNFVRTLTDMSGGGTWQISVSTIAGAAITVTPSEFSLAAGASQKLNIAVDVSDPRLPGSWVAARILLHKTAGGSAVDTALTMAVYSDPGTAPAFQDIVATHGAGSVMLDLNGLIALPHATFTTTSLAPAQLTTLSLPADPGTDDLYTFPGSGKQFVVFPFFNSTGPQPINEKGRVFIVEITASDAHQVNLYAGVDANVDGQPEQSEQMCTSVSSNGSVARCVIDLGNVPSATVNGWALVDVTQGGGTVGQTYSIKLSGGIARVFAAPGAGTDPSGGALYATGPGHVPAGADFNVQLAYGGADFSSQITPGRYYGAMLVDGVAGLAGQSAMVPFALTRSTDVDDATDALQSVELIGAQEADGAAVRTLTLAPGQSLQHMFMDVSGSSNPESLIVTTSQASGGTQNVSFYAAQTPFPASSAQARPAGAPAASSGATQWSLDATTSTKTITIPISSSTVGRWYLVATNAGSSTAIISLQAHLQFTAGFGGAPFMPPPGVYYNPQRSGHGIFVSEAAGQQVVSWYTYHEDGTPAWYFAQGSQPGSGLPWVAPMYRPSWDGSAHTITQVGDMILTPMSATQMILSWHLYGESGSETFTQLGAGPCPQLNGTPTNLNGLWYAPAQSGYGMDVLALPDQNYVQFYFYDSLGRPLWGVGAATPFAASTVLNMTQKQGFCPSCAYAPISSQALGTLSVNYNSATNGTYSTSFTLQPPLSGTWNINQPIARLTGTQTCQQ